MKKIVDLDVNADQVVKVTNISLLGTKKPWEDVADYITIVKQLVETYISLENEPIETPTASAFNSADNLLESSHYNSKKDKLMAAIDADFMYESVANSDFRGSSFFSNPSVKIPSIFQQIIQFSGKKLPEIDTICAMFSTFLNPAKTTELIKMKMTNFARQLSAPISRSPSRDY